MSVLRGTRKPGKKWSRKDRALALALTLYESDLCKGCGQPMSLTTGKHAHKYQIERIECEACAEIEDDREGSRKPKNGEKTYVVPV